MLQGTALPEHGAAAPALAKRTNIRFQMLWLIVIAVTINYLDRAIVGIAAPGIRHDFGLNAAELGLVFSAFGWTYLLFQLPGGIALDRFGNRIVYALALAGWSVFTFLQGIVTGIGAFVGMRFGLGVFEAPCFPANSNAVGMWFPRSERGRAISVYTAAEYVGLGFLSPLLFWMMRDLGWRSLFLTTGIIGLLFAVIWWAKYRDPYASQKASPSEIAYIEAGGGAVRKDTVGTKFEFRYIRELFRYRQMWGLFIGQFSVYSTFVFFLTWFPTYLATQRHMTFIKEGFYASLPYIAGFFGILFAGLLTDWLLKRASLNMARKLPVIIGLLLASTIILANYVASNAVVIVILSVAFFGQAMSSIGWAVLSEISPKGLLGLVGGLFSFAANLASVVIPIVIGFIVQDTGSFVGALVFVGVVAAVGAISWIFVIGDIHVLDVHVDRAEPGQAIG